ncbi:hypothetical protein [Limnobaculum parvum]|uniref:hypothetical protein n=1 Tax=Limnobaculum parvum TaxID=2172103 RepID=UPI001300BD16|nr:hypothetical protein [Limnobaculum parvum]
MLIGIEGINGDVLLSGKVASVGQLKQRMMIVLGEVSENDFVSVFCARYGYDIYTYDQNIKVDYVIDLGASIVYKPVY